MATLTWRNVDAPNFSGALDGFRTASQLLDNAVRSAQGTVGMFSQANSDAADRAILNRALGMQDAAAFQAGLADGSIVGADGRNASVETLRGLDTRVGDLLSRSGQRQMLERGSVALDQARYDNARAQQSNALSDAAAPDIAQARLLARNNDQQGLNALLSSSQSLRALRPEQLTELLMGSDALAANNQSRRTNDSNFTQGQWRFGREQQNATDEDNAGQALINLLRTSGNTTDAQINAEAVADGMTPGAFRRLLQGAQGAGYNLYGPVGDSSFGSGPASVMTGGASLPTNIRTVGDMVDNKSSLLRANPRGTATGIYQITADTWSDFAPRALGENWRDADIRDPEVQDRVGEAIWNSAKGSPESIRNRWASISPAQARELQGRPWSEVRDIISQGETSSRATEILSNRASNNLGAGIASQQLLERSGQNQAQGLAPELNQLLGDRSNVNQVVNNLTGENGALRGSNRGVITDYVNWIVQNSGGRINPAMAGAMLERNIQGADNAFERAGSLLADVAGLPFGRRTRTANLAGGVRLNDAAVYQAMDDYLSGATSTQAQAQQTLGVTNEVVQSAQQAYNAADAQYQAMLSASQTRPGLRANLERYRAQRDAAEQALRRVVQSVVNNDTLTPRYDRPVATSQGR